MMFLLVRNLQTIGIGDFTSRSEKIFIELQWNSLELRFDAKCKGIFSLAQTADSIIAQKTILLNSVRLILIDYDLIATAELRAKKPPPSLSLRNL